MKTINSIAVVIAALITLPASTGASWADESTPASAAADRAGLLKAINFALTGSDSITFQFSDEASCVVTNAKAGTRQADTFYLNAIDASRTKFFLVRVKDANSLSRVELHGESVIRESGSTKLLETTLDLPTQEHERVSRAWKYIYSHGCTSAKSSF